MNDRLSLKEKDCADSKLFIEGTLDLIRDNFNLQKK